LTDYSQLISKSWSAGKHPSKDSLLAAQNLSMVVESSSRKYTMSSFFAMSSFWRIWGFLKIFNKYQTFAEELEQKVWGFSRPLIKQSSCANAHFSLIRFEEWLGFYVTLLSTWCNYLNFHEQFCSSRICIFFCIRKKKTLGYNKKKWSSKYHMEVVKRCYITSFYNLHYIN
jgi:hypothetical protein